MKKSPLARKRLCLESLESRLALSVTSGLDDGHFHTDATGTADIFQVADAKGGKGGGGGNGGGGGVTGPEIRLDLVALHELGHSLGLEHSEDPGSIMYAYYNANYDLANFSSDPAAATLAALYADVNAGPWKDSLDAAPGNGVVDITYSFMPDGARMDKASNTLFATFDAKFGSGAWQPVFADQFDRWELASGGKLSFVSVEDTGLPFNYSGAAQNDARSGDIRIGAHRFDGAGKVLAHTYLPPPNGATAAGDAHFDNSENWVLGGASTSAMPSIGSGRVRGSHSNVAAQTYGVESGPAVVIVPPSSDAEHENSRTTQEVAVADPPRTEFGLLSSLTSRNLTWTSAQEDTAAARRDPHRDRLFHSLDHPLEFVVELAFTSRGLT